MVSGQPSGTGAAITVYNAKIAEAALGHVVPGVEGDYRRRDALTLRRQLMQKWADFVDQPWQDGANVIRIRAACIRRHRPGCIAIKAYDITAYEIARI